MKEDFYYIELKVKKKEGNKTTEVIFNWERNRLFDLVISASIFEKVIEAKKAKIISVNYPYKRLIKSLLQDSVLFP